VIALVGERRSGKSRVLRWLDREPPPGWRPAYVPTATLQLPALVSWCSRQLAEDGVRVVLLVDDAQRLGRDAAAEIARLERESEGRIACIAAWSSTDAPAADAAKRLGAATVLTLARGGGAATFEALCAKLVERTRIASPAPAPLASEPIPSPPAPRAPNPPPPSLLAGVERPTWLARHWRSALALALVGLVLAVLWWTRTTRTPVPSAPAAPPIAHEPLPEVSAPPPAPSPASPSATPSPPRGPATPAASEAPGPSPALAEERPARSEAPPPATPAPTEADAAITTSDPPILERVAPTGAVDLVINAMPEAHVWIDGVALGNTPLARVLVRPGPHRVDARFADGRRRSFDVEVSPTGGALFLQP
jgi:hypothetical protein